MTLAELKAKDINIDDIIRKMEASVQALKAAAATLKKTLAGAAAATLLILATAACGGSHDVSSVPPVTAAPVSNQVPCSQQVATWASSPGYGALKHLNNLAWNPIDINASRIHSAINAVKANPLPVCAQGNGQRDWTSLLAQMNRAELNANAGNDSTAAGALGSAAGIMMSISWDVDSTGYMGKFPG